MERSNKLALLPSNLMLSLITIMTFLGNLTFFLSIKQWTTTTIINSNDSVYLTNNELLYELILNILLRWSLMSSAIALITFIIIILNPGNSTILRIFNLSSFLDFSLNFISIPILAFLSLHPLFSNNFSITLCEILTKNEILFGIGYSDLKFRSSRNEISVEGKNQFNSIILNNVPSTSFTSTNYFSNSATGGGGGLSWGIESCEERWWQISFAIILILTGLVLVRGMMLNFSMDYSNRVELIMRDITSSATAIEGEGGEGFDKRGDYKGELGDLAVGEKGRGSRRLGRSTTLPSSSNNTSGRSSSRSILGRYKSNTISHPSSSSSSSPSTSTLISPRRGGGGNDKIVLVPVFYEPHSPPSHHHPSSTSTLSSSSNQYVHQPPPLFSYNLPMTRRFSSSTSSSSTSSSSTSSSSGSRSRHTIRQLYKTSSSMLNEEIESSDIGELIPGVEELKGEVEVGGGGAGEVIIEEEGEEEGDEFDKSL